MPAISGNVGAVASVSSVFGRNGGVVAATGDYSGVVAAHLTGATAATRYVGGTASGAPVAGTFAVGDFVIEQTGKIYVCTVAGTPGTWAAIGGSSPVSGAMVSGMDETNATNPVGEILTICPTVVYDTDGYVDNSDPTETALIAPTDGLYFVTYEALVTGSPHFELTVVLQNGGPDNNSKADYVGGILDPTGIWARVQQVVRLHAGDSVFATLVYSNTGEAVRALMGVGEPTGGWTITKVGSFPA